MQYNLYIISVDEIFEGILYHTFVKIIGLQSLFK